MLKPLYDWTMNLAAHRHALVVLAVVAFVDSSVFPIPPDVLIIPMVLAARTRAWRIAAVATIASVLGGLAGYAIGAFLFESLGQPLLDLYGYQWKFTDFQEMDREWGEFFGPYPYKVIAITSGVMDQDLAVFMIASVLSRGARFFLVAGLLWYFGPPIRRFIEDNLTILTTAFFVLLIGGFVAARYLL